MTNQKKSGGTRAVAFILAALISGAALAGIGLAETREVCQRALEKCLVDAAAGLAGGGIGLLVAVSSCLAGYDFCRKYINPPA